MLPPDRLRIGSPGSARMSNCSMSRRVCSRTLARWVNPHRRNWSRSSSTRFCSTDRFGTTQPRRSSLIRPSPACDPTDRVEAGDVHPGDVDGAARRCGHRAEHADELGLAVAAHAGDADDLARRDRDRHVVEQPDAVAFERHRAHVERGQRREPRRRGVRRAGLARPWRLARRRDADKIGRRPAHAASSAPIISAAMRAGSSPAAGWVTTWRPRRSTVIAVGDGDDLVQLVRDEHDAHPVRREPADRVEQRLHVLGHEHRGRLVEDQHAAPVIERLEDLHPLPLADGQRLDGRIGVDVRRRGARRCRAPRRRAPAPIDDTQCRRVASITFSVTVIGPTSENSWVTSPMPARIASFGDVQPHRRAIDADLSGIGLAQAVEDPRQRALAGAVLAEQGVHLAGAHVEVDAVVGDERAEPLGEPGDRDKGRVCRGRRTLDRRHLLGDVDRALGRLLVDRGLERAVEDLGLALLDERHQVLGHLDDEVGVDRPRSSCRRWP